MRSFLFLTLICLLSFFCCNNDKGSREKQLDKNRIEINQNNESKSDDSICIKVAISFTPTSISLSESIQKDVELDMVIGRLREKQLIVSEIVQKRFVYIILLKMYYYHLVNAHQGFDLFQMCDTENGKYIVNQFKQVSNLSDGLEMLNSGFVSEYIKSNQMDIIQDEESKLLSKIEFLENKPIEFIDE